MASEPANAMRGPGGPAARQLPDASERRQLTVSRDVALNQHDVLPTASWQSPPPEPGEPS